MIYSQLHYVVLASIISLLINFLSTKSVYYSSIVSCLFLIILSISSLSIYGQGEAFYLYLGLLTLIVCLNDKKNSANYLFGYMICIINNPIFTMITLAMTIMKLSCDRIKLQIVFVLCTMSYMIPENLLYGSIFATLSYLLIFSTEQKNNFYFYVIPITFIRSYYDQISIVQDLQLPLIMAIAVIAIARSHLFNSMLYFLLMSIGGLYLKDQIIIMLSIIYVLSQRKLLKNYSSFLLISGLVAYYYFGPNSMAMIGMISLFLLLLWSRENLIKDATTT